MKKKLSLIFLFSFTIFVVMNSFCFSLIPPTKEQIEKYKKDGTFQIRLEAAKKLGNYKTSKDLIKIFNVRMRSLLKGKSIEEGKDLNRISEVPFKWEGMPTIGTVKIPVVLISFADKPNVNSRSSIYNKIFGSGDGNSFPLESLRNFYLRSSYNQLKITGNVLGWYKTQYSRDVAESKGRDNLIKEVINYYDGKGHDFSQYDNDNDGDIDYLVVIWSGQHGEWSSFWWAYQTGFSDNGFLVDGKKLGTYSWQWESYHYPSDKFSPSTLIHETGHALGLPDLYDYKEGVGPEGGVGGLDIMDSVWGDHNCFSKFLLGWLTPDVSHSGNFSLNYSPTSISQDALLIMPGANSNLYFSEFFMVQYRKRVANDKNIPTDGLLIWHIDSTLDDSQYSFKYDNSYTEHKYIRLMEADGLEEIEQFESADEGDFYLKNNLFSASTSPGSRKYDGTNSGVFVKNISDAGQTISFETGVDIPLDIVLEGSRNEEKSWIITNYYAKLDAEIKYFREIEILKFAVQRKKEKNKYATVDEITPDKLLNNKLSYVNKFLEKERKYSFRIIAYGMDGSIIGISNEVTL